MGIKEKLIKLLDDFPVQMEWHDTDELADHLIANGVTIQQWIPVTDRVPPDDCPVLVTCGRYYRSFIARYDHIWKKWRVSHTLKITHWMPLPDSPKEGATNGL